MWCFVQYKYNSSLKIHTHPGGYEGRKDIDMKFNHYTINTYNNVVQDSKEILEDNKYRGYLCNLLKQIKYNRDTPLHLTKNIYVKGVVE